MMVITIIINLIISNSATGPVMQSLTGSKERGNNMYYVHTMCCMAHWELTYSPKTGKYTLQCEKCGKKVFNVDILKGIKPHCDLCGQREAK